MDYTNLEDEYRLESESESKIRIEILHTASLEEQDYLYLTELLA